MFKKRIIAIAVLFLLTNFAFANLQITVSPDARWGTAPTSNIKKLCENVASHFQAELRDAHKVHGKLTIVYNPKTPIAFYRTHFGGDPDAYKIGLTVTDTYWDNFTYQFGHEFCHILHNHDLLRPYEKNGWFHEALCEMANMWVMRRMYETWADNPPYENWRSYRHQLKRFADQTLATPESQYEGKLSDWLKNWEDKLREQGDVYFSFELVAQISYRLLPLFEKHPEAWNAVRQLPASDSKMTDYMKEWYEAVDTEDKIVVEAIATEFGISVQPVAIVSIDADVNKDGYVDLYDVMIVRSGMRKSVSYDTDLNNDGVTDEVDLLIVKAKAVEAIIAASPRKRRIKLTTLGAIKRR